ncbi:MAG: threonylcarbamoyl-AMP synthase [Candidatus Brocadiaceae bacterium]|nr:threonylcarbamoyl-AMP synthase [Candidatus Brocadiaceae bacterium]
MEVIIKRAKLLNVREQKFYWKSIETAAEVIRAGEPVAFPTETVYGLGVREDNDKARECIYQIKNRSDKKKLSLMIADIEDLKKYVDTLSVTAKRLVEHFWPGALGIIFPLKNGTDLCIRLPDNSVARDLIHTAKISLLTTSANISGNPPATNAQQVMRDLHNKIRVVLDGGATRLRSPSTIIKFSGETFEIVRHGIISETVLRNCLENGFVKA